MILVEKHVVKESDSRYAIIDEAAYKSKNLYNASLYAVRQYFFETKKYLRKVSKKAHVLQSCDELLKNKWEGHFP